MKKFYTLITFFTLLAALPVYGLTIATIDNVGTLTTPKSMMGAIDTNFGNVKTFIETLDTEAELKVLYNLEIGSDVQAYDADLADLADGSLTGAKVGFADTDSLWTAANVQAALEEMNDVINAGAPNGTGAKVNWSQLLGVPAGFADGTDDGAGATQLVDIVTTSPLRVNAGDNVNDALPGSDADITFSVNAATDSAFGVVELSTDAESVTGTSDVLVVTPGTLTARLASVGAIAGFTTLAGAGGGFAVDADGDTTVKSITVTASTSPGFTPYDSDLLGADKTAGFLGWQGVTLTDGAEDTDFTLQIMQGGALTTVIFVDESDDQIELKKNVDLETNNLKTTGIIKGRMDPGPDITGSTAHDTTELHNTFYHFTAAATVTLDAAADAGYGSVATYWIRDNAEEAKLDPQAGEKINIGGTALAAGVAIAATGAGKAITLVADTDVDGSGTDGYICMPNTGWASE